MMTPSHLTWTRLEKAAFDNGFDVDGPLIGDWRTFTSSQTSLRIWLTAIDDSIFVVAVSRWEVFEALKGLGIPWNDSLPPGAPAARITSDLTAFHRLLRRAFQLSRALPDEPLQLFFHRTANMPATTEAERLVIQRVGQDLFRHGLIDYWEGRCAISGLGVVELLRASHIKPWADCETDAQRLDIFNGLLLAPHLDAVFDHGFMTIEDDGLIVISEALDATARESLGIKVPMRLTSLADQHRTYLTWHRERVFRRTMPLTGDLG
jgi:putative restriction endonuclease